MWHKPFSEFKDGSMRTRVISRLFVIKRSQGACSPLTLNVPFPEGGETKVKLGSPQFIFVMGKKIHRIDAGWGITSTFSFR